MPLFNTPREREVFIETLVAQVTQADLQTALEPAKNNYLRASNAGFGRTILRAFVIPSVARSYRLQGFVSSYQETDSPQASLLKLLQGEGGTGLHSFKWILIQELSKVVKDDNIKPIHTIYGGPNHDEYILSHEQARQLIVEIAQELERKLKPTEMVARSNSNSNSNSQ